MHRVPRVILTVCLAIVFCGGRYTVGREGRRTTEVGSVYTLASFASQPPNPVAGADLEEFTGKARVCLSMLNTFLRRIKKRPISSATAPSGIRNSTQMCSQNKSKEIQFEARS
jgi:hypothetical protein